MINHNHKFSENSAS